jgi:pyruvate dehydrogenase E2 component (dihydrolipoamide acetyltransferase)
MTAPFFLPELGEHVESADLIKILVSIGDRILADQPVLEMETEKASFELPSPVSGVVREIHVREGEKVKVGQLIFTLTEEYSDVPAKPAEKSGPAPEIMTAAVSPAPPMASPTDEQTQSLPVESMKTSAARPLAPASPMVRRLARELGVSVEKVPGSGPAGRIVPEDVKAFAKGTIESARGVQRGAEPALPDFSRWGEIERMDMTRIRRKIAESMSYSWSTIPHVTNFESADITALEELRKRSAGAIEAAGGKLTITSIMVKVIASGLKVFPRFTASVDMQKAQFILKKYCHIGVAVDTDRGLIVPVIRDADKKNILQLSVELAELAERVRSKKITLEELEGAVFTITNLGGIGGNQFTPIIHAPEVAILGISKSHYGAVLVDGRFEPRLMLPLALSYDHRLIDGADAARFLRWVAQALEQTLLLPLEG